VGDAFEASDASASAVTLESLEPENELAKILAVVDPDACVVLARFSGWAPERVLLTVSAAAFRLLETRESLDATGLNGDDEKRPVAGVGLD
jgi:hypothetical protein